MRQKKAEQTEGRRKQALLQKARFNVRLYKQRREEKAGLDRPRSAERQAEA